jgi:hypothetical protein
MDVDLFSRRNINRPIMVLFNGTVLRHWNVTIEEWNITHLPTVQIKYEVTLTFIM